MLCEQQSNSQLRSHNRGPHLCTAGEGLCPRKDASDGETAVEEIPLPARRAGVALQTVMAQCNRWADDEEKFPVRRQPHELRVYYLM